MGNQSSRKQLSWCSFRPPVLTNQGQIGGRGRDPVPPPRIYSAYKEELVSLFCCLREQGRPREAPLLPGDLFLNGFRVGLSKQVKHGAAEIVRMTVWVPQLIGNRVQEEVPAWSKTGSTVNGWVL